MFISSAFAQTAPAAASGGDMTSTLMSMLPLILMFVVLYFVMIRPQMKKQKEHRAMIEALTKGDEVVTAGGFLGKVSKLGDAYVGIELASGVEVQMQRSAVVQVLPKGTVKSVRFCARDGARIGTCMGACNGTSFFNQHAKLI